MITLEQYFGAKPYTPMHEDAARELLSRVDALVGEAVVDGAFNRPVDPDTGTEVSGSKGGAGDGGFRLPTATTGTPSSAHKQAMAVDVFDPANALDRWLDRFEGASGENSKLEEHGLYRETPNATQGWCHLTTRAPRSGRRTYLI